MKTIVALAPIALISLIFLLGCLNQPNTTTCNENSDCTFAYVGLEACSPCDFSDSDYQCVSPEYADQISQQRYQMHGIVMCKMCSVSPQLFRCLCSNNICVKTSDCTTGDDCYSKSFGNQYKCIKNKCSRPTTEV